MASYTSTVWGAVVLSGIILELVVVLGAVSGDAAGGGGVGGAAAGCLGAPSRRPCLDQSAPGLREPYAG